MSLLTDLQIGAHKPVFRQLEHLGVLVVNYTDHHERTQTTPNFLLLPRAAPSRMMHQEDQKCPSS